MWSKGWRKRPLPSSASSRARISGSCSSRSAKTQRAMGEALQTPALVLNLDALERNLQRMAEECHRAGIALRPHAKTHKSPWVAARQIALGAVGICTSKVGEAEVMVKAGIGDVLITT